MIVLIHAVHQLNQSDGPVEGVDKVASKYISWVKERLGWGPIGGDETTTCRSVVLVLRRLHLTRVA